MAGVVVLLRAHVDHPHVVVAEHVGELRGGDQQVRIGIVRGTGRHAAPAIAMAAIQACHPRFMACFSFEDARAWR